jgi:putative nucleotidyltransferase with HDIG domain
LVFDDIQLAARQIVADILRNRQAMVHLTEIRTHDDYTFAHSVDVCTLAVLVAARMGYVESRLQELAVGALLHDIGKLRIEQNLLNKPGKLSEDEMSLMRGHALFGFEILRSHKEKLSFPSMHISLQHHEKYDGTGYPRGLKCEEIHEFSRIVSVVDVYAAITADRPYRKALLPHEAHELMIASGNQHFDPQILPLFLERIAVYPVGTVIRLNTGDLGVVVSVPPGLQSRPTVRLILDPNRRRYLTVMELDMRNHLTVFVDQVVDGKELFKLV